MQGDNGAGRGSRPRVGGDVVVGCDLDGDANGRFFLCALCREQVLICSRCDRGQIYCAAGCRFEARRSRRRDAARRYQSSRPGRFKHAARSRRYRARHKIVTHHGSPAPPPDACVPEVMATEQDDTPVRAGTAAMEAASPSLRRPGATFGRCCHWCGQGCSPLVRRDHLRRRQTVRFRSP